MASDSQVRIGLIYPEVFGVNGDNGNAIVLKERLVRRNIDAEIVRVDLDTKVPSSLDIYLLGGTEHVGQVIGAEKLRKQKGFRKAIRKGVPVLAVGAAMQIMGQFYPDAKGRHLDGLHLLDVVTVLGEQRSIGEVVAEPIIPGLLEPLTGFENHLGQTSLGPDASPLATVIEGEGNGSGENPPWEGAVQGSIVGTYLHGPVLARNPELADYLLAQATEQKLPPLQIAGLQRLREERLAGKNPQNG